MLLNKPVLVGYFCSLVFFFIAPRFFLEAITIYYFYELIVNLGLQQLLIILFDFIVQNLIEGTSKV